MRRFLHSLRSLVAIIALTALAACASFGPIPRLLTTQSAKEKEIAALRVGFQSQMEALRTEVEKAAKQVVAGKDAQINKAGGGLYAADLAFSTIHTPTRTDLVINNYVNEAWTALGRPMPTYAEMDAINKRLRDELDEAKTSLQQLQANHAAAMAENQALAEATAKHQATLAALEAKRVAAETEFRAQLDAKQGELIGVQGRLIAAEKARADDRAALQALKTKMSLILGALALAGIAGAIWSPIMKDKCALFAVVCGGASVGLWWLQPYHVAIVMGVTILALLGWVLVKYRKEERVADALVLAAQDVKEKARDVWDTHLKPAVTDRLARYRKAKGGKLVTERDPTIEAHIDRKLAEWDALPAKTPPTS